jgi:hypothetical protein
MRSRASRSETVAGDPEGIVIGLYGRARIDEIAMDRALAFIAVLRPEPRVGRDYRAGPGASDRHRTVQNAAAVTLARKQAADRLIERARLLLGTIDGDVFLRVMVDGASLADVAGQWPHWNAWHVEQRLADSLMVIGRDNPELWRS